MPNSIPYNHPSMVLGNIIDTKVMAILKQIGSAQSTIDAAQEKMNSFIAMKRSLAMTINELLDMNVDTSDIEAKMVNIDTSITAAANAYITNRIDNEAKIQTLKENLTQIELSDTIESPVDFENSQLIDKPLASESLKLDAQYFSFDINMQTDTLAKIESFIRESTSDLGSKSKDIAQKASNQIAQQNQQHNIAGTLIITASCTHKNVALIEPCILDPDKTVNAWNATNKNNPIDVSEPQNLVHAEAATPSTTSAQDISILSGAAYGSSFVGMVHILNSAENNDNVSDDMISKLNNRMRLGGWLAENTGGIGVSESVLDEVKRMLDTQKVSAHITLLTMGAVTSIASNKLKLGLEGLTKPSGYSKMSTDDDMTTVDSSAAKSVRHKRAIERENLKNRSILNELQHADSKTNQILDINSLMAAFDNYISSVKGANGITGIPIHFYTKKINKQKVIDLWLNKYEKELRVTSTTNQNNTNSDD